MIGARRKRQGLGEFLAKWFVRAGAGICAIVGTTPATVNGARRKLLECYGIDCRGYIDLGPALELERPDIVVIASPYAHHLEQLRAVAKAGAHCLCEKPLWWGESRDRAAETEKVLADFAPSGYYLGTVTQWPHTLPYYYHLYPHLEGQAVEHFAMELSPITRGPDMVIDAAPHVLSMLFALLGEGRVCAPHANFLAADGSELQLDFEFRHARGAVPVQCRFATVEKPPRPASYAINGHLAMRTISLPEYRMYFTGSDAAVEIEDPLELLVKTFLRQIVTGAKPGRELLLSVTELECLHRASILQ